AGASRSFGRHVTFRAYERGRFSDGGHQTDVRQLRNAVYEYDVGRLNVPVDEPATVKLSQCGGQRQSQLQAFVQRKPPSFGQFAGQSLWHIIVGVDRLSTRYVVRCFHHIVEKTGLLVSANVQDADPARVGAGNRLESLQAVEFTFEGSGVRECLSIDDLNRSVGAHHISAQPHLTVTAAADAPQ